jgi:hypothetical protein
MTKAIGLTDGDGSKYTGTSSAPAGSFGGAISLETVLVRPIGISPTVRGKDFQGTQWPPEHEPLVLWRRNGIKYFTPSEMIKGVLQAKFPPRAWDPAYYQIVLLTEFARIWIPDRIKIQLRDLLETAVRRRKDEERRRLIELIEFRAGDLDEVLSQMTSFDAYFQGALGYTPPTHPCTNYLVQGAMRAGEFAAMYYKNKFQRPRPWQLWPQLMPPVAVPGHASYPSAHSTQAHTIAHVLQRAIPEDAVPDVKKVTTRLAQRIAIGREVLGLHYQSDTEAGERLAEDINETFQHCPEIERLVHAAQEEWKSYMPARSER